MRLSVIDFLKGYSIFTIVIFHLLALYFGGIAPDVFFKAISFVGPGVHVFILCSGFGLCLSQLKKTISPLDFYKKRFAKIYIPYIIVVLISAAIPFVDKGYIGNDRLIALLSHIFLFKMFDSNLTCSFGVHFWFISMIIQFYIIFPYLYKVFIKTSNKKFITICIVLNLIWATFVAIIGKEEYRAWNSFFMQYLWEFALGMILARFYIKNNNTLSIPSKSILCLVSILGLVLYGLMGFSGGILKLYNDIPALFGYLSLALLLYSFSIGFINKFFSYTSSFSYEWYLIHPLIFSCVLILNNYFFKSNSYPKLALLAILALIASYLLSIVYHKLINQLIKRLK